MALLWPLRLRPPLALLLLLACIASSGAARAGDDATDYAESALAAAENMYLETEFDAADELLQAAITRCGEEGCKAKVHARLHVFRAEVLVTGLERTNDARAAMRAALKIAPNLELDPQLDSKAVFKLLEEVKNERPPDADEPDAPRPEKTPPKSPPEGPAREVRNNWIRASFMVDFTLLLAEQDICTPSVQDDKGWVCTRADESRYRGFPTAGQQNAVDNNLQLSTMRATLGYERLLGDNVTLGVRLGFAFRPASSGSDEGFVAFHGEGRAAYWFGDQPFADIVRPNLFLALGFGPVITPAELTVIENGTACGAVDPISGDCSVATDPARDGPEPRVQRLQANKTGGPGFGSFGFGLSFSPTSLLMIDFGVRVSATFPVFTPVLSPEAGMSFGF